MKKILGTLAVVTLMFANNVSVTSAIDLGGYIIDPIIIEPICYKVCGDGILESCNNEQCDDGNTKSGDGCSSSCLVETNWECTTTSPSVCTAAPGWNCSVWGCFPKCGDSMKVGAETCDDGNTTSGDGCGFTSLTGCQIETGWTCSSTLPSSCSPICGDGLRKGNEVCDDGNINSGDGCSSTCKTVEHGYTCTGSPSVCTTTCGDNKIAGTEQCDDGNTANGDGCSATCNLETGWTCGGEPTKCVTTCGDGIIVGSETCDDGNTENLDGCDNSCQIETGWICAGGPSSCYSVCGDGLIVGAEECDDGNKLVGDGCNSSCKIEEGWNCEGSVCIINDGPTDSPPASSVIPHFSALVVEGVANVGELVVNGATTFVGSLFLQDQLRVDGQTWFYNVVTLGNDISDSIYIAGPLKGSALGYANVTVDDNLDVFDNLRVGKDLTVDGNVTLGGAYDVVTVSNRADIGTRLNLGDSGIVDPNTAEPLWVYGISRLFGYVEARNDLSVAGTTTLTGTLTANGGVDITGGVDINGHLQANSIGKITVRRGSVSSAAGAQNNIATVSCSTGEVRLGCGGNYNGGTQTRLLGAFPPYGYANETCFAYGANDGTTAQTLYVYAICLDPDGV